jgi:phage terminase large subunit-like protein
MTWCVSNMATEENAWREIRPVKINPRKRIDGGVALIDALAKKQSAPAQGRSVYMDRGAISLEDYL